MNKIQENNKSFVGIDDIAANGEISLNTDDSIDNMTDYDPAIEEAEVSDVELETVESTSTIATCSE